MILGITDAKGLTDFVSQLRRENKGDQVPDIYRSLFATHEVCLKAFPACKWSPVKTTGDGVMFFSEEEPRTDHLRTLSALQDEVRKKVAGGRVLIRVIACYIDSTEVVRANDICGGDPDCTMKWLANDLFGHHLNKAFRLLSAVSSDAAVVEQPLLERVYAEAKGMKPFRKDADTLQFDGPVPITVLKGIGDVGFSTSKGKAPHWLWEIAKS